MGVMVMGGEYRGRRLATDTRARVIRPTSGKVREALFSSLGGRVPGGVFADLYAGSGAVGFEALSRGAAEVHLVENHPQSLALIADNILSVTGSRTDPRIHLARLDAAVFCREMSRQGRRFDVLFADPPFDRSRDFAQLPALLGPLIAPGGVAVVQYPMRAPPAWVAQAEKVRKYGESGLAFFGSGGLQDGAGSIF
jgi:16S rRNA (guanine966-N2)-methyltransferase